MPPETNPRLAFERLFGDADTPDPALRAQRARERTSILDVVAERSKELMARLGPPRSEEHTSELQSRQYLVCRLLLEKEKKKQTTTVYPMQIARDLHM